MIDERFVAHPLGARPAPRTWKPGDRVVYNKNPGTVEDTTKERDGVLHGSFLTRVRQDNGEVMFTLPHFLRKGTRKRADTPTAAVSGG